MCSLRCSISQVRGGLRRNAVGGAPDDTILQPTNGGGLRLTSDKTRPRARALPVIVVSLGHEIELGPGDLVEELREGVNVLHLVEKLGAGKGAKEGVDEAEPEGAVDDV